MKTIQSLVLASTLALAGSVVANGQSQAAQSRVQLAAEPPLEQLRPLQAGVPANPARLTVQALDAAGQPLQDARIRLQVLTPAHNPWFPTDFPIVEGTKLLELTAIAPTGELPIQQMLPIRGAYQLVVQVEPLTPGRFAPFQQTLTLPVAENHVKYRNFGLLVLVLLGVGLAGGWVMGGRQTSQPGELAPQRVRLLLSVATVTAIVALLGINISAELAADHHHDAEEHAGHAAPANHADHSHANHNHAGQGEEPTTVRSQGLELRLSGSEQATVGIPGSFTAQVTDTRTGKPVTDVVVQVTATQLEEGWTTFAYGGTLDQGQLTWEQQFFDGAPHRVMVTVSPKPYSPRQFQPLQVSQTLEVTAIAPPLLGRLIVLGYFTGVIVLGLLLGLQVPKVLKRRAGLVDGSQV